MNEEEKPPNRKTNMGIGAGYFSPCRLMARRLKGIWSLWSSDWDIPVSRDAIFNRRYLIFKDIPKESWINNLRGEQP